MKKNPLLIPCLIALSGVALSGCEMTSSDNVKAKAVFQGYHIECSEEPLAMTASAQFTVAGEFGTTLELKAPSHVTYNGGEMKLDTIFGALYTVETHGTDCGRTHSFRWVDEDGVAHVNSVHLAPLHLSLPLPSAFSTAGTFYLPVTTDPGMSLDPNDTYSVHLSQTLSPQNSRGYDYLGKLSGDALAIDFTQGANPDQGKPQPGKALVSITVSHSERLRDATEAGGSISTNYALAPFEIEVTN